MKRFAIRIEGWTLVGLSVGLILAAALALILGLGGSEGARSALRFTARTSLVLFLLAFTASAALRRWPNAFTHWMRRNRRYLGIAFAGSHLVHALAIAAYGVADAPGLLAASQPPIGLVINGIGYAFILAMLATSFPRPAAALGPVTWHWLHRVGAYYLWFGFAKSYIPRAVMDGFYVPFALVLGLALAIRLWDAFRPVRPGVGSPA